MLQFACSINEVPPTRASISHILNVYLTVIYDITTTRLLTTKVRNCAQIVYLILLQLNGLGNKFMPNIFNIKLLNLKSTSLEKFWKIPLSCYSTCKHYLLNYSKSMSKLEL